MFYVYKWYIVDTNEIIYIGKGTGKRAGQRTQRNKIFREILKNNNCQYEIIKTFEKEEDAFEYEHETICKLKKEGQCICNLDYGGKGGTHLCWTDEMRKYYSKYNAMKSQDQRERMSKNNPMKNLETREKVAKKKRKSLFINGIFYENVKEAALKLNKCTATIREWCKIGLTPDNQKCRWANETEKNISKRENKSCKKVEYKSQQYDSAISLARELKVAKSTVLSWLKKGFDSKGNKCRYLDDKKEHIFIKKCTSSKPIIIDGIHYESVVDAARHLNIKDTALHYHIHHKTGRYLIEYDNQQPS